LVEFSFSSSDAGVTFECSLEASGAEPDFQPCVSPADYGPLSEGAWTFQVRAVDGFGVVSNPPAQTTFVLSTSGPVIFIDSAPASLTTDTSAAFAFHPDQVVTALTCQLDAGPPADCLAGTFSAIGLIDGQHTLTISATDEAANTSITTFNWTVDSTPPVVDIVSGPADPTVDTQAVFGFSSSEPGATFVCTLDGGSSQPCVSGIVYSGLASTTHTFSVQGTDPAGNMGVPSTRTWKVVPITASPLVKETKFLPKTSTVAQGTGARWSFKGRSDHTVTDSSALGLFDSGAQHTGATFSVIFGAAGSYPYKCTIFPTMTGVVQVPVLVSPTSGTTSTQFTVTWASTSLSGYVFDVMLKRPGSTRFIKWKTGQLTSSGVFVPDGGSGTYTFKSRLRNASTGAASTYSNIVTISVT
jgi:plastocyanin